MLAIVPHTYVYVGQTYDIIIPTHCLCDSFLNHCTPSFHVVIGSQGSCCALVKKNDQVTTGTGSFVHRRGRGQKVLDGKENGSGFMLEALPIAGFEVGQQPY
jgi:hypothetical protein